jgi:hypothetical protein
VARQQRSTTFTQESTRPITRVALYARVSTLNNQDPEMQLAELREYAGRRGWEIVEEFTDHGVSGCKESRPALNRLMADACRRTSRNTTCRLAWTCRRRPVVRSFSQFGGNSVAWSHQEQFERHRSMLEPRRHWLGLPVVSRVGDTLAEVLDALPHFGRQPFAMPSVNGHEIGVNSFLDMVYRLALRQGDRPIPVGVVSKNYRLVDHHQLLRTIQDALTDNDLALGRALNAR